MKATRKLLALLLALLLTAALTVPALANGDDGTDEAQPQADTTYTITINNNKDGHIYEAYQVFAGDLAGSVLSNIEWGTGVNGAGLLAALKIDDTIGRYFTSCEDAADVAKVLTDNATSTEGAAAFASNSANLDTFAAIVGDHLKTVTGTSTPGTGNYTISNLPAGYYFVKDSAAVTGQDAQTKFILNLTDNQNVTPKSGTPTVDKQVQDETADAEAGADESGWGETADHAINESFQFKLIAKIPDDADMNAYEHYYVNFVDTWSAGVTFEKIVSVTVNSTELNEGQYTVTPEDPTSGTSMNITINDIIPHLGEGNDLSGSTVTVIYKAHLNENATVNNTSGSTDNKNTVKLEFSNNPYWNGEGTPDKGETPEDTVWVFTYQVNNTKVDASNENKPLPGAGFKLYSDETCAQEIALIYDETKQAYRPVKGEEQGVEMISAETTGVFHIIGLDAGTYYLKETTVPAGYNEMSPNPFVVTIKATHEETNETTPNVTLAEESTMQNQIENSQGATLPETGGMGTTVFYVLGGILAVGAGVLLVARRRMRGER